MKIGVTQIILRQPLDDILRLCQEAGYDILELVFKEGGDPDVNIDAAGIERLKKRLADAGVQVTSLLARYAQRGSLLHPDPAVREAGKRELARAIELAGAMETGAILLHPGQLTAAGTYEQAWQNCRKVIEDVLPIAEKHKVVIGIENVWNKFLLSPKEMRLFLDEIGSPWVGCYLDTANMMAYGYPEHWIDELGKRIVRVHFKDFDRKAHKFVNLKEGETDWPVVMQKLRAIGYDAGVIHEVSGDWNHQIEMARRMREIVAL